MKLNLAPKGGAKKGASTKVAWAVAASLVLVSLVAGFFLVTTSSAALAAAKQRRSDSLRAAAEAVAEAKKANAVIVSSQGLATNIQLAKDIEDHNSKYTAFYRDVMPYIPGFLRLTRISVTPISETACQLNLSGVLYSAQQYADASVALLRIPGAVAISRTGYAPRPVVVPGLTEEDQVGKPFRVGGAPLPEDPIERMEAIIARANEGTIGFANIGNYGSPDPGTRGAMPTGSAVTFTVSLADTGNLPEGWSFNFLVPNPTSTLATTAAANQAYLASRAAAAAANTPGTPPGGAPPANTPPVSNPAGPGGAGAAAGAAEL